MVQIPNRLCSAALIHFGFTIVVPTHYSHYRLAVALKPPYQDTTLANARCPRSSRKRRVVALAVIENALADHPYVRRGRQRVWADVWGPMVAVFIATKTPAKALPDTAAPVGNVMLAPAMTFFVKAVPVPVPSLAELPATIDTGNRIEWPMERVEGIEPSYAAWEAGVQYAKFQSWYVR
jgi:hypothetical protein